MPEFKLALADYCVLLIYLFLIFSIGPLLKFLQRKKLQEDKLEDYFLAARKITLPVFVATLVSTWYGNILGVSELAYKEGLVMWLTQGIFWYVTYLFFAFFLAGKIRFAKCFTIPDLLEGFYDKKTAIVGALVNVLILNPATYILSIGFMIEMIFPDLPKGIAITIGTLIPFIYLFKGGYHAVVWTDFVHFIFMFIGIALIIPFALNQFGWHNFIEHVPSSHLSLTGNYSWQVIIGWAIISTWSMIDANFYQTTSAAKDIKTARNGILIAIVFWFIFDIMLNFISIYAFTVMPKLNPVLALPSFANAVLPPIAKGIFLAGVLATVLSTLDSLCFASAMCIAKDIYQRVFKIKDQGKIILVNKLSLIIVVGLGLLLGICFESMIEIMYYKGTVGISALLLPVLFGFFYRPKLPITTGFWSLSLGAFASITGIIIQKLNLFPLAIEPLYIGLFFSALPIALHLSILRKVL